MDLMIKGRQCWFHSCIALDQENLLPRAVLSLVLSEDNEKQYRFIQTAFQLTSRVSIEVQLNYLLHSWFSFLFQQQRRMLDESYMGYHGTASVCS
jgi:hypothetical protein